MNNHVQRKLIVRLLLAWIALSVLIGAVVLFIETRKINAEGSQWQEGNEPLASRGDSQQ
jgi:hypothetical protein